MVKTISILVAFFLFLFVSFQVSAAECKPGYTYESKEELEAIRSLCEQKVTELRSQANSLSSQIRYMDTQVYLTTLSIQSTEQKIIDTEKEIDLLNNRIDTLDDSLDHLSKLLLERIVDGYKTQSVSLFNLFFDSMDANDFLDKIKYQKTAQDNNQKLLVQVQISKSNFEEQKKLREKKKAELASLKIELDKQKAELDSQKVQKQKLLADTQNDEAVYQQILARARAQLSAFKSFVQNSGASSVIGSNAFGNGSDGAYFSQRDGRWANQFIGNSSENILNVGCLLTSISMVLKKNGVDTNPSAIASNPNYFAVNTAFMSLSPSLPNGTTRAKIYSQYEGYGSTSDIDSKLEQGNYVITGINYGACGYNSDHFVVLTKKDGNDYIMHDPLYGPDIKFSSHYSQICWAEVLK